MNNSTRRFEVPGKPVAKGRVRSRIITPKNSTKPFVKHYMDKKTRDSQTLIQQCYRSQVWSCEPYDGPVRLIITAVFVPPVSWSRKKKQEHLGQLHTQKPDLSNIVKQVEDALNKIAYTDDSRVVDIQANKYYNIQAKTIIEIRCL